MESDLPPASSHRASVSRESAKAPLLSTLNTDADQAVYALGHPSHWIPLCSILSCHDSKSSTTWGTDAATDPSTDVATAVTGPRLRPTPLLGAAGGGANVGTSAPDDRDPVGGVGMAELEVVTSVRLAPLPSKLLAVKLASKLSAKVSEKLLAVKLSSKLSVKVWPSAADSCWSLSGAARIIQAARRPSWHSSTVSTHF